MSAADAEVLRKRYLYRRLVLEGKVSLPPAAAARLIGPDCAYHLYACHQPPARKDRRP